MKFLCDVGNFFYTQVHILSEQLIMIVCGLRLSSCFGDSLVVILQNFWTDRALANFVDPG